MRFLSFTSKSKVNLYLRVGNLRDDGYHEIRTIVVKTDLGDRIKMKLYTSKKLNIKLSCSDPNIPTDTRNTVIKILSRLNEIKPLNYDINIGIDKIVPYEAGLGGGSGDAAAVAIHLNNFLRDYYEFDELIGAGKMVGADLPLFFYNGIVEMGGAGDEFIKRYENFEINFVVAKINGIGIKTGEMYKNIKNNLTNLKENISIIRDSIFNKDIGLMASALINDFEGPVFERYKDIYSLKNKIIEYGALNACLSGSGAAVYGIAKDEDHALYIKEKIVSPGLEVFTCKSTT